MVSCRMDSRGGLISRDLLTRSLRRPRSEVSQSHSSLSSWPVIASAVFKRKPRSAVLTFGVHEHALVVHAGQATTFATRRSGGSLLPAETP